MSINNNYGYYNDKTGSILGPEWPDELHSIVVAYLSDLPLNEVAINYISEIATQLGQSLEKTAQGVARGATDNSLNQWRLDRLQVMHQNYYEDDSSYFDSDDEEKDLKANHITSAAFQDLPNAQFANLLLQNAEKGFWKTINKMIETGREITPKVYTHLIKESVKQGESEKFRTFIQSGHKLYYPLLVDIFNNKKATFDAYQMIKNSRHYNQMPANLRAQLDKQHALRRC